MDFVDRKINMNNQI